MTTTKKISELLELTTAENSDVLVINDVSAAQTKKIAIANLFNGTTSIITGSFKGNLDGNAATATTATSATNADNATNAVSASFATSASYAVNAASADNATNAVNATNAGSALTASYVLNAISSSYSSTSLTASYASNADLLDNLDSTAFAKLAASNVFTANQVVTGSITATAQLSAAKLGSKVLLVVEGGAYSTIQAAIDAAADNDIILVGPKASGDSWGSMVFSPGKRLEVASLGAKWSTQVKVDSITFNVSSGGNILFNTVFVRGLYINSSFTAAAPGVNFYGTAPGRLRLQECFIYNSNSATGTGVLSNNSGTGSSLYIDNCIVQSGWSTGIGLDQRSGYTNVRNDSEISRYQYPIQCAVSGTVEITTSVIDGTGATNEVVRMTGGFVTCGYTTIKNTTVSGSGVFLSGSGAAFGMGDSTFAIGTGPGYCVNGNAGTYYLYGNVTYSHSAILPYNVKVKNTVTAIPVSQSFVTSA